jgi:hypothetical protein
MKFTDKSGTVTEIDNRKLTKIAKRCINDSKAGVMLKPL